jgi:hypothetical protein
MKARCFALVVAALACISPIRVATAAQAVVLPEQKEVEDALPEGGSLTGRQIFDRFLENRLHSAVQYQTVISRDPGGNEQRTRFWVRWKDWRDKDKKAVDGVLAKGLVKFEEPQDMRATGFLMVVNEGRPNDQYVWSPATGKVRRVNLRGVGVMGTDYTFDDIAWKNIEDADYNRLPDEEIDGTPVYVVEVTVKPTVASTYKTARTWLEKQHYLPLRTIYRDSNGTDMREQRAPASSVHDFNGTWITRESTMSNLKEKTSTTVFVDKLDANVALFDRHFSTLQLTLRR